MAIRSNQHTRCHAAAAAAAAALISYAAGAIAELSKEYQAKGLAVVAISSNSNQTHPQDGPGKMAEDATANGACNAAYVTVHYMLHPARSGKPHPGAKERLVRGRNLKGDLAA
jgi:hypothetical protein